jgi:hypothetical protein
MFHRSRREVWIIGGWHRAELIGRKSLECRLKVRTRVQQKMGPLPDHWVGPCPAFGSIAVDLFRPIEYKVTTNKRQRGKGQGVLFICMATSDTNMEFIELYSTDSFLMVLTKFMCPRWTPSRVQSDRGEQLVSASKQIDLRDFDGILQWSRVKRIEWHLVPTGG